jgi:hypothetical protein
MSFFESFPDPASPPPREPTLRSPWLAPETVIPGSVPGELLLVHTEAIAVAIGSLRAFPNGVEFTVHVRLRRVDETSPYGLYDPFSNHDPRGREGGREQLLRLGVLFADGRRAVSESGWRSERDYSESGEPLLQAQGSGGSSLRWDGDFWLYPLPPDGPLTFIISSDAYGVSESRGKVDASAIRAAAGRAVDLWPADPKEERTRGSRTVKIGSNRPVHPEPDSK